MRAKGLTLLEVVAALVLVASSAVVLLNAQGRSLAQLRALREQETASSLARELITAWRLDPTAELAAEGAFAAAPGWSWSRSSQYSLLGRNLELHEITLAVYSTGLQDKRKVWEATWLEKADVRKN